MTHTAEVIPVREEEKSSDSLSIVDPGEAPLRTSTRISKPSVWMKDFVGTVDTSQVFEATGSTPPTFPYVVSAKLTNSYVNIC